MILADGGMQDAPAVARLAAEALPEAWSAEAIVAALARGARLVVARHPPRLIGYALGTAVPDGFELWQLAVAPTHRRRGVGRALLARIEAGAHGTGWLEVRAANAAAIAFYRRLGWRIAGRRRGYYTRPPDDAVLMCKPLGRA